MRIIVTIIRTGYNGVNADKLRLSKASTPVVADPQVRFGRKRLAAAAVRIPK